MPHGEPSPVLGHLKREQANATELYLLYKGYHWNVAGPTFRELHLMFDEHATTVLETIDALAERQRMLGVPAIYSLHDLLSASSLPEEHRMPGTTREMLHRLITAHRIILDGLQEGFRAADGYGDPGSADLFARFLQLHQKMEWFLRETAVERPAVAEEPEGHMTAAGERGVGSYAHPGAHAAPPGELPPPLQGVRRTTP